MVSHPPSPGLLGEKYIFGFSSALSHEYKYLNEVFRDPPGPERENAIQSLNDAESTVNEYLYAQGSGPGRGYSVRLAAPPGTEKFASDATRAFKALDVVVRDAKYVSDHCVVSGRTDETQNQFKCDSSYRRSDPHVVNVNADVAKFKAVFEFAHQEGVREMENFEASLGALK
jgi:hypothetical protein